jgi:steroid delta-isomerase-like uncharacterized protein
MRIKLASTLIIFFVFAASNFSHAQDNTEKIKDGINKVYSMFNSGDFTGIEKYIDDSYIEHTPSPGNKATREGLVDMIKGFRKSFPDFHVTINDMAITDTRAAILYTITGTNSGPFMGMPATNKKVSIMGIDYLMFNKDSKCTDHYGYQDDMGMMQQLGMMK